LPNDPLWITPQGVIQLNKRIVIATGEPHGLRDRGGLESACGRPQNAFYYQDDADVASLASCLLFGIAQNHPFIQGNKRTGFYAMTAFLEANSFRFQLVDDTPCAESIINVLTGSETEDDFAEKLRRVIRRTVPQIWH
jgi:death-on-curing protein